VDSNPKPSCFGINRQAAKSHLLQPPHPLSLPISFSHALPLPLPSRPTSLLLTLSLYPAAPPLSFSRSPSTQLPHLSLEPSPAGGGRGALAAVEPDVLRLLRQRRHLIKASQGGLVTQWAIRKPASQPQQNQHGAFVFGTHPQPARSAQRRYYAVPASLRCPVPRLPPASAGTTKSLLTGMINPFGARPISNPSVAA
jgi:hypothetical protein